MRLNRRLSDLNRSLTEVCCLLYGVARHSRGRPQAHSARPYGNNPQSAAVTMGRRGLRPLRAKEV